MRRTPGRFKREFSFPKAPLLRNVPSCLTERFAMKLHDWNLGATRREWIGGAAALGASAALPALPARAQASEWPNVTRLLSSYVEPRKVANMVAVIGFGQDDPTIIATGVDSFTGTRRSNASSIYRIYSMTKPVTGMAAMMLIDEGKLGLDQPLHEILPKFRNMQVQKDYDGPITADNLEPAVRPITIRQMLTHTAGLSYGIVQSGPIAQASRARGLIPGLATRLQTLPAFRGVPVRGLANFVDGLAELPLVYQPGTKWSYSMGFELLGRSAMVVTIAATSPSQPWSRAYSRSARLAWIASSRGI